MSGRLILVADDDAAVRAVLAKALTRGLPGCEILQVSEAARVLELATGLKPALILLDWVFRGGRTGASVCAELKQNPSTRGIPVILMTGLKSGLEGHAESLALGADLFLPKPFEPSLAVRFASALLQRTEARAEAPLKVGELLLRRRDRTAWWKDRPLSALPPRLFDVLWFLGRHAPNPVSREDLARGAWQEPVRGVYVGVAVDRLRRRLPKNGPRIDTVPGRGWRLSVS